MSEIQPSQHQVSLAPPPALPIAVAPQPTAISEGPECPTCGGNVSSSSPPSFIYAIGSIAPRFPQLSVEKEFAQATARAVTNGLTDRQALHQVLTRPENRYLVRQLCWVMTIEGLETYILSPRNPADFDLLVEALRAAPSTNGYRRSDRG